MKLRNALLAMDTSKLLMWSLIGTVVAILVAPFYGTVGLTNPVCLIGFYFTLKTMIIVITDNFDGMANSEFKQNLVYAPLEIGAGVSLLACAIPDVFFWRLLVIPVTGWLLLSGVCRLWAVALPVWDILSRVWDNTRDQRSFRRYMQQVALTARIENRLSADLKDFLMSADSPGSGKK